MHEGYATVEDGIRLNYRIMGEGSETLVIPAKCFLEEDLEPLAANYRLILYDPRGRGGSDLVPLDKIGIEHEVSDLEALRQCLSIDRFSLLGWSYLTLVVALYAAQYPTHINRLVMVGAVPVRKLDDPEIEKQQQAKQASRFDHAAMQRVNQLREIGVDKTDPERFNREMLRVIWAINTVDPTVFDRMRSNPFRYPNEHADHVNSMMQKMFTDIDIWDYRGQAQQIRCPVLVVMGVEDLTPMKGAEEWVSNMPDARLLRIERVAHCPWLEAPDILFPALLEFLNGKWPAEAVSIV